MKPVIITIFFFITAVTNHAQNAIFLSQGRIEYEKRINMYARMEKDVEDDGDESWNELRKKGMPQFKTTYFNLSFNSNKTLYEPGRENLENNKVRFWGWDQPAEDNIIFTDLDAQQRTSRKNVFEQAFLVQDSLRKIQWKITDEMRTIAGFECRRANALIMDSIYIVAFYTESITTSGGPESFSGLPGMILGVAIPHEHITWFATKVYTETIPETTLKAPVKGKKTNSTTLLATLQDRLKDWGKWARNFIVQIMI